MALAAGAAAWALHRRRALAPPAASLSPLAELERALGSLAGFEPEHGHVALSLAFRRYLGRALTLPATASTTSELARAIDRRGFEPTLVRRAVRLLRETDQIKFARRSASADELGRRAGEARELAVALDRQLHPPAEESAA
jgi:hypothetical protein